MYRALSRAGGGKTRRTTHSPLIGALLRGIRPARIRRARAVHGKPSLLGNIFAAAILIALFALAATAQAGAEQAPSARGATVLDVHYSDGRVTLEARNAPLAEVLRRLGEKAQYRTDITGDLGFEVNLSLLDKPLVAAIRRLVGGLSMVMILRSRDDVDFAGPVEGLYIYSPQRQPDSAAAGPREAEAPPPMIRPRRPVPGETVEWNDRTPRSRRIAAIEELALTGDEAAIGRIEQAVATESDPEIRDFAVQALETVDDMNATLALGRILFGDRNRETRRMAVQALASKRSAAARAFLEYAARDQDDEIRGEASEALERLDR